VIFIGGFSVAVLAFYFSVKRVVCPTCGNQRLIISYHPTHCSKCGIQYPECD